MTGSARRLRLRHDFVRAELESDGRPIRLLVSEARTVVVADAVEVQLLDLLDGSRTAAQVLAGVGGAPAVAATGLRTLRRLGVLTDRTADSDVSATGHWDAHGVDAADARSWLHTGAVTVLDAGSPALGPVAAQLSAAGLDCRIVALDRVDQLSTADPAAPLVVVVDSMTDPRLGALDDLCRERSLSYTLLRPFGSVAMLGPHLIPGRTACWHCLRDRWLLNAGVLGFLDRSGVPVEPARPGIAPMAAALGSLLAAELVTIAQTGSSPRLTGRLVTLDAARLATESHQLLRSADCARCAPEPARTTAFDLDAPYAPASDLAGLSDSELADHLVSRNVSRYTGVVNRLTPLDGADNGLTFSYSAAHSFAPPASITSLRAASRGLSGGKGPTDAQARIGAVGEAIERFSGTWNDRRVVQRASWSDLGPDRARHPEDLLLFSEAQYRQRDRINATVSHFHRVPRRLQDDVSLDWTSAWSLTAERPVLLPSSYCWYGHPDQRDVQVTAADSNGCAAAASPAEAMVRGFCELVERDAVALWWYHRGRRRGVDLDSFDDGWLHAVRNLHRDQLGRRLWVLDLTTDLDVPAFAAVSALTGGGPPAVLVGFGADLEARKAVRSAVTEVNQFLPLVRPDSTGAPTWRGEDNPEARAWFAQSDLAAQEWLFPDESRPQVTVDDHARPVGATPAQRARQCVDAASAAGLEVLVLDQSRPELQLAVVRTVVPGLRHFWRRTGPGRLYDAAARLDPAHLAADESCLNPFSVFF